MCDTDIIGFTINLQKLITSESSHTKVIGFKLGPVCVLGREYTAGISF